MLFCELSHREADFLIAHLVSDLVDEAIEDEPVDEQEQARREMQRLMISANGGDPLPGLRDSWPLGGLSAEQLGELRLTEPTRAAYVALLQASVAGPARDTAPVFAALRDSNLFAFELGDSWETERQAWQVSWCLHRDVARLEDVARALGETRLGQLPLLDPEDPAPQDLTHMTLPEAPVAIAPLGRTALSLLPRPLPVPAPLQTIQATAEALIGELAAQARWDPIDGWFNNYAEGAPVDRQSLDPWLEEVDGTARIAEIAQGAAETLSHTATILLPPPIADRYSITVKVRSISQWLSGDRLELLVRDLVNGASFPIAKTASGMQPWLQLALLRAIDALERLRPLIAIKLDAWLGDRVELEDMKVTEDSEALAHFDWDTLEDAEAAVAARHQEWAALTDSIASGRLPDGVYPELEPMTADMDPRVLMRHHHTFLAMTALHAYIIDEPEQHLHPSLQRQLAPWLAESVWSGTAQAIVSTHAVQFLNAGRAARTSWVYLQRNETGHTELEPIVPERLHALSNEARELGWDRGELLANAAVWLFVEGRVDQAVLETLIGSELHRQGVAIVPLHGEARASGVLDADILLRYSSAPVAIWLDRVPEASVLELLGDEAAAIRLSTDSKQPPEIRTMAKLIATANHHRRRIHPIPHPGRDVVDLLDEEVIAGLYPRFPGHAAAHAAAAEAGAKWKDHYRTAFGLELNVPTVTAIARAMTDQRAEQPTGVARLLELCTELAISGRRLQTPGS